MGNSRSRPRTYSKLSAGEPPGGEAGQGEDSGSGSGSSVRFSEYHDSRLQRCKGGVAISLRRGEGRWWRRPRRDCGEGGLFFSDRAMPPDVPLTIDVCNLAVLVAFVTQPPSTIMARALDCSRDAPALPEDTLVFSHFAPKRGKSRQV